MVNTPINKISIKNKHNKNSLIKYFIEFQLINTQIGIKNAVSITKKIETPSTPKIIGPKRGSIIIQLIFFII